MNNQAVTPILIPMQPQEFWEQMRLIVREEVDKAEKNRAPASTDFETPGLTQKPLYKISEVCKLFEVSRQTIYEWIRAGKLKPYKIRSRVYFLQADIQGLLSGP